VLVQLCKAAGDAATAAQQSSVLLAYQIAFDLVESENQVRTVYCHVNVHVFVDAGCFSIELLYCWMLGVVL
jgi:hypothetical protein